jgi:hypothetical protein
MQTVHSKPRNAIITAEAISSISYDLSAVSDFLAYMPVEYATKLNAQCEMT